MDEASCSTGSALAVPTCCDPLSMHKRPITSNVKCVTPLFGLSQDLVGKWLCNNCIQKLKPKTTVVAETAPKVCFAPYGHKRKSISFLVCITHKDDLPQHLNKWVCTNCLKRLKSDAASNKNKSEQGSVTTPSTNPPEESTSAIEQPQPLSEWRLTLTIPESQPSESDNVTLEQSEKNVPAVNQLRESEEPGSAAEQPLDAQEVFIAGSCFFAKKDTPHCSPEKFGDLSSLPETTIQAFLFVCDEERNFFPEDAFVCMNHYNFYFGSFKEAEDPEVDVCCDPCHKHFKNVVRDCLYTSLLTVVHAKTKGIDLMLNVPLCRNCRKFINELPNKKETTQPPSSQNSEDSDNSSLQLSGASSHVFGLSPGVVLEELNHQLNYLGITGIDVTGLSKAQKVQCAKDKLAEVNHSVERYLCRALNIELSSVISGRQIELQMASDYEKLMLEVKEKLLTADRKTSLQLLTLCPDSWTSHYAAKYFGVSRHSVDKARELKEGKGILSTPSYASRSPITDEIRKIVEDFYCDDMYSRMMPGKKDYVSLGHGQHMQKRLILCNLVELYTEFKKKHPETAKKIGKSTFISMRPKWCVIAGSAGTHNVCVCETHQNAKLLLRALGLSPSLREIIPLAVCTQSTRECKLSLCANCPSVEDIAENIKSLMKASMPQQEETEEERETKFNQMLNEEIEYNQWESTDRDKLSRKVDKIGDVIDLFAKNMKTIVTHDFIAYEQASFLQKLKEDLPENKAIIMMDFSMNYTCIVQDATQKYHWSKKGVTVHPVVIYYKDSDGTLKNKNLCFISDDVKHDVTLVRLIQEKTIDFIKKDLPQVDEVIYVTDGCAAQYKCCSSFFNLCQHEKKFGMKAEWFFFATSHGKSPCDGIGGLVKREIYKESLRRPYENQILNAIHVFGER